MKVRFRYGLLAFVFLAAIAVVLVLLGEGSKVKREENRTQLARLEDVPEEAWEKLAEKKIFFGHQSVGYNILSGVKALMEEHDYIKLRIVETTGPADFDGPILAHAAIGRNGDTTSKIQAFKEIMESGVGEKVDIAFFKFCYIDIKHGSDSSKVHEDYKNTMDEVSRKYPDASFLHLTSPLKLPPSGRLKSIKASIKSLAGKKGVLDDNIRREEYNSILKGTYSGEGTILDLALAESVDRDGFRCYVKKQGRKVFVLIPEYTTDGGHLSEDGSKRVAEQFLIALARIVNE